MAVLDEGQCDLGVHITQHIKVQMGDVPLNLDDVLLDALLAAHVLEQRHAGVAELFQLQQMIQRKTGARRNVVDDHAVQNFVNVQHGKATSPVLGSLSPSSVIISAMRIYTPLVACSK